ncbi:MAG: mannose-1-phosphate guanylyltransferase [Candidatus Omnitrophica bacterium]|nr:mannose-1-phosphate guanylyltransferase [Candidatus Omnitrophota bacterium]
MKNKVAFIMAGGLGERFWPATSRALPKYAIRFNEKTTFLKDTFDRLAPLYGKDRVFVITSNEHARLVRGLLPRIPAANVLGEPERKNTAAATAYSTLWAFKKFGEDTVVSFFPADALVEKPEILRQNIERCCALASADGVISVIGIEPTRPATGYGYIECGARLEPLKDAFEGERFCEKPDLATAKKFIKSGRYVWNAGIFTWSVRTFDSSMRRLAGDYYAKFLEFGNGAWTPVRVRSLYASLPSISIDKLLAEKADRIQVVRSRMGWDDIGTWEALRRMSSKERGNVFISPVLDAGAENCVFSLGDGTRAVAAGVKDVVVVRNGNDFLICSREKAEDVRELKNLWAKHFKVKL